MTTDGDGPPGILTELLDLRTPATQPIEFPPVIEMTPAVQAAGGNWVVRTTAIPIGHVCDAPMAEAYMPGHLLPVRVVDGAPGTLWRCRTCFTLYEVTAVPIGYVDGSVGEYRRWERAGRRLRRRYRDQGYDPGVRPKGWWRPTPRR